MSLPQRNIFNTAAVLASPIMSTDDQMERVAGIVAHEYFHNYTGNRVTCRDWFQLTLKEGLTVYRDQRELVADRLLGLFACCAVRPVQSVSSWPATELRLWNVRRLFGRHDLGGGEAHRGGPRVAGCAVPGGCRPTEPPDPAGELHRHGQLLHRGEEQTPTHSSGRVFFAPRPCRP